MVTITYHFALRGYEYQELLHRQDLVFRKDDNGRDYIELATAFLTKNHQGSTSRDKVSDGLIQKTVQVPNVRLLLEKLNLKNDRIFQMATCGLKVTTDPDSIWFSGLPLGPNTIKDMMKRISDKACSTKIYTNHCIWATAIQRLIDAGVPEAAIIGTTGHTHIQSLTAYATRNSESRKSQIAAILDRDRPCSASLTAAPQQPAPSRPLPLPSTQTEALHQWVHNKATTPMSSSLPAIWRGCALLITAQRNYKSGKCRR